MTFNINLWSLKKYFWFPGLSGVTIATILTGSARSFVKSLFHMFPYREILKVLKAKSDLTFRTIVSKYQISAKQVKGFGCYEHLKFGPM